jgi:hypothetical protein
MMFVLVSNVVASGTILLYHHHHSMAPTEIISLQKMEITKVIAGDGHFLALSRTGKNYPLL